MIRPVVGLLAIVFFATLANAQDTVSLRVLPFSVPVDCGTLVGKCTAIDACGDKAIRQAVGLTRKAQRQKAIDHAQAIFEAKGQPVFAPRDYRPAQYLRSQKLPEGKEFWSDKPSYIAYMAALGRYDWQNVYFHCPGSYFVPSPPPRQ
jgi:hypothetical protein